MAPDDDSGLFAKHVVFDSVSLAQSEFKTVSFCCRDCKQWSMVHDNEVPDCHKGHDVVVIRTVHYRHGDGFRKRTSYINVD